MTFPRRRRHCLRATAPAPGPVAGSRPPPGPAPKPPPHHPRGREEQVRSGGQVSRPVAA